MIRSLPSAMDAFVENGGDRSRMNVLHWSDTFHATPDQIREAFEVAMTKHSTKPQNTYCEGK